ncbi:MAG: hypothetical protein AB7U75_21750 [Hyphomicrobiaceae bacterium]
MRFWSECTRAFAVALLVALSLSGLPACDAAAGALAVAVENKSEHVLCAEKDNVTLAFASPQVQHFRIEAAHPSYINAIAADSFEPDWTACEFKSDALAPSRPPQRETLYEDIELWIVAHRYESFWRDAGARVVVGDKVHEGIHLLQVWVIRPMGGEEVMVLYPQDGYWRMRPKAPAGRAPTAFGSSFLIGPLGEDKGRPVVDIAEVDFDPGARTFTLRYKDGNRAQVALGPLDEERHRLEVTFAKPIAGRPFAAIRSMYVTRFNNDVADVAVLEQGTKAWTESPVMEFRGAAKATELWAGRIAPSRHNTSSPDMVLKDFHDGDAMPSGWRDPSKPPR